MDPQLFIEQSFQGLQAQTAAHTATWHLGKEENWDADQDSGRLRFTFADGTIAEAPFQIVGTYDTLEGTFLWGWDHPSVDEDLRKHAELAKQFGDEHRLSDYAEPLVECTEDEAWAFAAVAARLGGANGVYRGSADTTLIYMTFGNIEMSKP